MNLDLYKKKQIVFPSLLLRLMTTLIEVILFLALMTIPNEIVGLYLYKINFADFIAANNIELNTLEDLKLFYTNLIFSKQKLVNVPTFLEVLIWIFEFVVFNLLVLSLYFIFCWNKFGTTFCSYIVKIKVVDYETGKNPKLISCIIRYISYIFIPISIFMIAFGKEKKGLHDIFAGTIVIKN